MKLGELLDRLASPIDTINSSDLIEELGLHDYVDLNQHGFTSRAITTWICTDTAVGRDAIYLNGELVAVTQQDCRKCPKEWTWASKDAYYRVYQTVMTALSADNPQSIKLIDREWDVGNPVYRLNWANEVQWNGPHRRAVYQGRVVEVKGSGTTEYLCSSLKIVDGKETKVVPMDEVYFTVELRPA